MHINKPMNYGISFWERKSALFCEIDLQGDGGKGKYVSLIQDLGRNLRGQENSLAHGNFGGTAFDRF